MWRTRGTGWLKGVGVKRVRFAARRRTVGLSQEALAEQLHVDRSTVIRWEHGTRAPQPWQRPNLATALKVSLEELDSLLATDHHSQDDAPPDQPRGPVGTADLDALVHAAGYGSL